MSEITPDEVSREVDSNSFQNLVANTIDEEHAIRVAFEAGIAFACRKQKGECFCGSHNNTFFGKDLISSTVDSPTVPEHLMCENPYCDALHHQNENKSLPCPWKAG